MPQALRCAIALGLSRHLLYLGKPHRPWRLPLGEDRSGSPSHIGRG
ncbi:hypothetical protein [Nostoc sp.]